MSIQIGHGASLSEWEKWLPHFGWWLREGEGCLVYTCMSVCHSVTCDMNRKSVEDTVFTIWKLSFLLWSLGYIYCTVYPVQCLVVTGREYQVMAGFGSAASCVGRCPVHISIRRWARF